MKKGVSFRSVYVMFSFPVLHAFRMLKPMSLIAYCSIQRASQVTAHSFISLFLVFVSFQAIESSVQVQLCLRWCFLN